MKNLLDFQVNIGAIERMTKALIEQTLGPLTPGILEPFLPTDWEKIQKFNPNETFEKCPILFKFKEGKNFNHRNT